MRKAALPKKSSLHKPQEFSLNSSLIIITVSVFRGREPAGQVRAGQATDLKRSGGAAEWCELSKKTSALTSEAFQNALCCLGLERGLVAAAAATAVPPQPSSPLCGGTHTVCSSEFLFQICRLMKWLVHFRMNKQMKQIPSILIS